MREEGVSEKRDGERRKKEACVEGRDGRQRRGKRSKYGGADEAGRRRGGEREIGRAEGSSGSRGG
jgi:hypothetical protein